MLKDITIGQYMPADSVIHDLDPRTKIMGVILIMIGLFAVDSSAGYGWVAFFSLLVMLLSMIPFSFYLRGLKPLIFIIVLTMGIHIFMTPGEIIWQWKFMEVTKEGIYQGSFMALRLILLILVTSVLTLTTTPIALTDGIELLLNPFKRLGVPAHELAMMMTIALRFIPTLSEETEKIMKAQIARGADFESGNILKRAKALIPLLVPLFLSAFRRADDLAMAMEARCYRGGDNRTRMKQLAYTKKDGAAVAAIAVFLGGIIFFRVI